MKTTTIPVVIGALGLIKKGTGKYIQKIPGATKIQELQKIALLGTSHIHQVDFNLVVTLGLRTGPVMTTYHSMKQKATDDDDDNDDDNDNDNDNEKYNVIIIIIIIVIIITITLLMEKSPLLMVDT